MQGFSATEIGPFKRSHRTLEEAVYACSSAHYAALFAKRQLTWLNASGTCASTRPTLKSGTGKPWVPYIRGLRGGKSCATQRSRIQKPVENQPELWIYSPNESNGLPVGAAGRPGKGNTDARGNVSRTLLRLSTGRRSTNQTEGDKAYGGQPGHDIHFAATTGYGYNDLGRGHLRRLRQRSFRRRERPGAP